MRGSSLVLLAALACASRDGAGGDPATRSATAAPQSQAKLLRASPQCGGGSAGATWIGSAETYESALRDLAHAKLGDADPPPTVDFTTHGVVRVDMGPRPTGGYAVELGAPAFARDGATGVVRVTWTEPPPDALTAQVLTSPCLLVAVPREGLRDVRVVDQGGAGRGRADVR